MLTFQKKMAESTEYYLDPELEQMFHKDLSNLDLHVSWAPRAISVASMIWLWVSAQKERASTINSLRTGEMSLLSHNL